MTHVLNPDTPFAHVKGAAMLTEDYSTSFAIGSLLKDILLARAATMGTSVNTTLAVTLENIFQEAEERGLGDLDIAVIYPEFELPDPLYGITYPAAANIKGEITHRS
ncbi:MAG: hypothetical protein V4479_12045 [Actinomycetota bacterium]